MKSLIKSIRVAAEIFTPPLLFSIVLALQMARPVDHEKKMSPVKETSAIARLSR